MSPAWYEEFAFVSNKNEFVNRTEIFWGLIQGTKFIICVKGYFPRERLLEIYDVPTSELSYTEEGRARGQMNDKLRDPKVRKLTEYNQEYWQNYNLDTDTFEDI